MRRSAYGADQAAVSKGCVVTACVCVFAFGLVCLAVSIPPVDSLVASKHDHVTQSRQLFEQPEASSGQAVKQTWKIKVRQDTAEERLYSSFSCTGLKWNERNEYACPYCRSCRFDNVCLNHSSLNIQYYSGKDPVPLFYDMSANAHHVFPDDFLNTGHVQLHPGHIDWAPMVIADDIPRDAVFSDAPVAAYASLNDHVSKFSFALFDYLYPVFNLLKLLGVYDPNFQLILAEQHQGSDPSAGQHYIFPDNEQQSLLALISRKPAATCQGLAEEAAAKNLTGISSELTCFRRLVAGTGSLQLPRQRLRALPFRSAAFKNMGLLPEAALSVPLITLLNSNKRRIENMDQIHAHLQDKFPSASYNRLESSNLEQLSIRDRVWHSVKQYDLQCDAVLCCTVLVEAAYRQSMMLYWNTSKSDNMKAVSSASILITTAHEMADLLTFMQPKTTAIVSNHWQTAKDTSKQSRGIYYWNIEFLTIEYFPVLIEDYEGTTDRPECEMVNENIYDQGSLVHCNVNLKDLQRLEHFVTKALINWNETHNSGGPMN